MRCQVDADEIACPFLGEQPHQRHGAVCAIGQQGAHHPATPEAAQDAVAAQTAVCVHAHGTAFISIHLSQQGLQQCWARQAAFTLVIGQQGGQVLRLQQPGQLVGREGGRGPGFHGRLPVPVKLPGLADGRKAQRFIQWPSLGGGLQHHVTAFKGLQQVLEKALANAAALPGIVDDDHADAALFLSPLPGQPTADQLPIGTHGQGCAVCLRPADELLPVGLAVGPAQRLAQLPAGVRVGSGQGVQGEGFLHGGGDVRAGNEEGYLASSSGWVMKPTFERPALEASTMVCAT